LSGWRQGGKADDLGGLHVAVFQDEVYGDALADTRPPVGNVLRPPANIHFRALCAGFQGHAAPAVIKDRAFECANSVRVNRGDSRAGKKNYCQYEHYQG
jgi:hypothetical protein